tara:strand:- start:601 stop:873 length:273 start_codon:yes stop_codon:yes gene_type:complete
MSETKHYKGKLIPTGKTLDEFDCLAVDIYDLEDEAVLIDGLVFTVEKTEFDECEDIFESVKNPDGTIDFQVKYYDGGCGFNEAIENALEE